MKFKLEWEMEYQIPVESLHENHKVIERWSQMSVILKQVLSQYGYTDRKSKRLEESFLGEG